MTPPGLDQFSNLDQFIKGVPMPLVLISADARIQAINPAAAEVFGNAGLGLHYAARMRQPAIAELVEAALKGAVGRGEFRLLETGQERRFSVQASPWQGHVLLTFEDLSQSVQAQQIRSDFVANVSHELKTPLTALMGFIETLRGPARQDPQARERFLAVMAAEAGRMDRLISDLLSLSRVESLARQRPSDRVDMTGLITNAEAALRPMAEAAGVDLRLDLPKGAVWLRGAADQLTQVVVNLVENAVKYGGGAGGVDVSLTALDSLPWGADAGVRLQVTDYGAGFDPVHIPRLTERFYRIDDHRSRPVGGTGLGLAIAKHIVQRHRGRISISSEPAKGAVFTVFLPVD